MAKCRLVLLIKEQFHEKKIWSIIISYEILQELVSHFDNPPSKSYYFF